MVLKSAVAALFVISLPVVSHAQNPPSGNSVQHVKGPKTLFESVWGIRSPDRGEEEDRVEADRPHFPEASTAAGKGRVILESGYTYTSKGSSYSAHSAPETLLRIGMFSDWFEFRIGQNFTSQREKIAGVTANIRGAQDLYLGFKIALNEQF